VRPVGAVWTAAATSESEGSAADEDHDAEADENDGEEDVLPAFEHFGDRGAGGDELCQGHQDRDEREEDDAVGDYCERLPAVFLWGGATRSERALRVPLRHGDVLVWGGVDRLRFHGVLPVAPGEHPATGQCRINLTLRKAL